MLEPAVHRRPRLSIKDAIRAAALIAGALLVVLCWCLFLTPIHVTVRHAGEWVPQLRVDGVEQRLAGHPVASLHRVSITNISDDAATVELALPIPDGQPRLRFDELASVTGRWTSTSYGERVESTQPGSEITIELNGAEPELPFLDRPDGGRVRIRYDGTEREVDLASDTPGWHWVRLPPRQLLSVATLAAQPLGASFEIRATKLAQSRNAEPDAGIMTGEIRFGARKLIRNFELSGDQAFTVGLPSAEIVPLVLEGVGDFAALLGWSVLAILAFTLAGASLAAADPLAAVSRSNWIACFTIGFSLFALLANTSAYFFSARASAPMLGALLLAAVGVGVAGQVRHVGAGATQSSHAHLPLVVIAATALGLWLSFWPLSFAGPGFLGTMRADSYFYATTANAIQSKSLLSTFSGGGLIGNGMRSIDLALAASLSSISGLTTGRTWLVICMALMLVPAPLSYCLVRDWLGDKRVAVLAALSVALSAPMASLFFESYLVQYVTTAALYLNLYTALPFTRSLGQPSPVLRTSFAHGLTSALVVLLYPYFAVVPVATFGIALWTLRKHPARLVRHLGLLIAIGLAVGNVGYTFMLNHAATGQFVDELNAIARHIVFPFHDRPKFAAFVFGLAPFHASAEMVRSLMAEITPNGLLAGLARYLALVERRAVFAVLGVIGVAYLLCLAVGRRRLLDGFGLVLAASLLGYLLLLFVAWQASGVYATCKLAWTLATLLPLIIVPALALPVVRGSGGEPSGGPRAGPLIKALAAGALGLLLTGNLISRAADPIFWIASPTAFDKANTSLAVDLAMLDAWHPPDPRPTTRFALADVSGAVLPPDQAASVLAGHVYSALVGRGYACVNCDLSDRLLQFTWFRPIDVGAVDADLLVVIGKRPATEIPGWETVLHGERLSLHARPSR